MTGGTRTSTGRRGQDPRRDPARDPGRVPGRAYGLRLRGGLAAAALALLATACGGGGADGPGVASDNGGASASAGSSAGSGSASASPGGTRQDQLVAFARCMREKGVEVADPAPGDENVQLPPGTKGDARTQEALAACQGLLGAGGKENTDASAQDKAVRLARCLRDKGLDVADPEPGKPLQLSGAANDPKAREAITECRASVR
ncbi:hypothetical protein ACF065_11530 [Streptomyces sp. NPDC015232]|uniref:hypothetical protein n=1 Tax=unclassified Streptomyces TaxID=2593676 RepID=UPI0036FFF725